MKLGNVIHFPFITVTALRHPFSKPVIFRSLVRYERFQGGLVKSLLNGPWSTKRRFETIGSQRHLTTLRRLEVRDPFILRRFETQGTESFFVEIFRGSQRVIETDSQI